MTTNVLTELIEFKSGTQTLINKIAEVLVNEFANQQALAVAGGKDPTPYDIRVFTNRFKPFDQFKTDFRPLINITLSDDSTKTSVTGVYGDNQKATTILIDCFGVGIATETPEGHTPADLAAALSVQDAANLVRYILRADINFNLQLPLKLFNSVVMQSEQYLAPDFNEQQEAPVVAMRLMLTANVTDKTMINNGAELDSIVIDIERGDSGEIYATAEYDYTT